MPTAKAQTELRELEILLIRTKREEDQAYFEQRKTPYGSYTYKGLQLEIRKLNDKYYKIMERRDEIIKVGLSSLEQRHLKRELSNFTGLSRDTNLGTRDRTVMGYSKTLGEYVIVRYTSYSGFMRNVRGMGSLAGTKSIHSVKIISKSQYDRIMSMERKPSRQRGWGSGRASATPEALGGVF